MAWLLLSQVSTWAVSVVMIVMVPRLLTDSQFGRVEFAFTFVSFFQLVAASGSGAFIVKSTARDPSLVVPYVFNDLVMKLVLIGLLSPACVGLATLFGYERESVILVAICCLAMLTGVLNGTVVAGLHGRQQMKGPAAWAALQQYVSAGASLAVLVATRSLLLYTLVLVCSGFIPLVANFARLWPEMRSEGHVDLHLWRVIAVGGVPFLLWNYVQLVYGKIDIPLLQALAGPAEVGWYALAYNWVSMPVLFAVIVSTAFFPSLSAHGASASAAFRRLGNQSLRIVMFVGLPAATGIALVAEDMFSLLHYSAGYRHAIPLMPILALHIPIVGMDIMLGLMLIAVDRQRQWIIVGCVAAVLNPLLNLAAIPITVHLFHNGAIGASIVTVLTELMMMVGAIRLRPDGILDRTTTTFILRCAVASLVMVPAELALRGDWFLLRVVVGALVYLTMSLVLRTFSFRRWRQDFLPGHEPDPGSLAATPVPEGGR
jgi:O-antigen/teichoic acid export membrane protein